jgi:hypothetical protein
MGIRQLGFTRRANSEIVRANKHVRGMIAMKDRSFMQPKREVFSNTADLAKLNRGTHFYQLEISRSDSVLAPRYWYSEACAHWVPFTECFVSDAPTFRYFDTLDGVTEHYAMRRSALAWEGVIYLISNDDFGVLSQARIARDAHGVPVLPQIEEPRHCQAR